MAALAGILVFLSLLLSLVLSQFDTTQAIHDNSQRARMLAQAAQQEAAFFQASLTYVSGLNGYAGNGSYIQVSDLTAAGLLPSSFSPTTPFGQTLEAWMEPVNGNQAVIGLYVFPVGTFSTAALQQAGFGAYASTTSIPSAVYAEVGQSITAALSGMSWSPPSGTQLVQTGYVAPGSTDLQLLGLTSGQVLAADTGIADAAYSGGAYAPAVMAVAPGALGYLVVAYPSAGAGWAYGFVPSGSPNTLNEEFSLAATNVRLLGWAPVCPVGATLIGPGSAPTTFGISSYLTQTGGGTNEVCIQAYKSDAYQPVAASTAVDAAYAELPYGEPFPVPPAGSVAYGAWLENGGAGPAGNGTFTLTPVSTPNPQLNVSQAAGFTYSYSGGSGSVPNIWSLPGANLNQALVGAPMSLNTTNGTLSYAPGRGQNNFFNGTLPALGVASVLSISVAQPSGTSFTTNTYTLSSFYFVLPEGTGLSLAQLNLPTPTATDPLSGYTGMPWLAGMQAVSGGNMYEIGYIPYNGMVAPFNAALTCPTTANLDSNVLATNCTSSYYNYTPTPPSALPSGLAGAYSVTAGSSPVAAIIGSPASGGPLSYYDPGLGANVYFSVSVPPSLQTTVR